MLLTLRVGSGYGAVVCADLHVRLLSEDGEEMRRISETSSPEWLILRHVPRYVLVIDRPGGVLEVKLDLEARKMTVPR